MHGDAGSALGRRMLTLFCAPALPLAAIGVPLSVYLPTYYSVELGVSFAAVGLAFMLVRLLDMLFDPLLGLAIDRTETRIGRFKPWMVVGAPILMLGIYLLFSAETGVRPLYLWLALGVTYVGFSMCQLSQVSWAATLSGDYDERSRIYAWWQVANIIGALTVVMLPVIAQKLLGLSHAAGVRSMGWFIILMVPVCVGLAIAGVREGGRSPGHQNAGWRDFAAAFRSKPVRIALMVDFTTAMAIAMPGALFFYFLQNVKGIGAADASLLILFYLVAALIGAPLWKSASLRWGKHHALAMATALFAASLCFVTFVLPGNFWAMAFGFTIIGTTNPAPQLLVRAMVADAADEELLRSGVDTTGILFGYVTAVNKIGNAVAVGVAFLFLDWQGASAAAPAVSRAAPLAIYAIVPACLSIVSILLLLRYPLTPERHRDIRAALIAKRQEGGGAS